PCRLVLRRRAPGPQGPAGEGAVRPEVVDADRPGRNGRVAGRQRRQSEPRAEENHGDKFHEPSKAARIRTVGSHSIVPSRHILGVRSWEAADPQRLDTTISAY